VGFSDDDAGYLKFTAVCNHPLLEELKTRPLTEALVQHGRCYVFDAALDKPFSDGLDLTGCEDEELWRPYLRPIANAAMAAIDYVCGSEPDMEWAYLPGAPEELVRKTASVDHREARRAVGMLAAMGYRPMWFCGLGTS
jgi:hypothetical protein